MKVVFLLVVALFNTLLALRGASIAFAELKSDGFLAALDQCLVFAVPFASVGIHAFRAKPWWLWSLALLVNFSLVLVALALGFIVTPPDMSLFAVVFPAFNLAYLFSRMPSRLPQNSTESEDRMGGGAL